MAKEQLIYKKRKKYENYYLMRYYEIYLNKFSFKELDDEMNHYSFKQLWFLGTFSFKVVDETKGSTKYPNGLPIITPYAPSEWNLYDFPVKATLINKRGLKQIPSTLQEINKDIVVCWANKLHLSIKDYILPLIRRLAHIEVVIEMNLNAHKVPFLIPISPEDEKEIKRIWDSISEDEEKVFVKSDYFDKLKTLSTGVPYILDNLYALRDRCISELNNFFGIGGLPIMEKKEHLINSEVESNDENVEYQHSNLEDEIQEFCKRVKDYLGFTLTLSIKDMEARANNQERNLEDEN